MNNSIRTYEDLLLEQARLRGKLDLQGQQIKLDLLEIKDEIKPVFKILSFIGRLTTNEPRNNILLKAGIALSIELLAKKFLSKYILAGIVLPPLLKNISSNLLSRISNAFIKK